MLIKFFTTILIPRMFHRLIYRKTFLGPSIEEKYYFRKKIYIICTYFEQTSSHLKILKLFFLSFTQHFNSNTILIPF